MRVIFLYTELAGYFVSCVNELTTSVDEIHIVRWPVNREAPFEFLFANNVTVYQRDHYTDKKLLLLVRQIKPDKIFCSGWIDKGYLSVCRSFKSKIPVVMSMDNPWNGSLRQQIRCLIAPLTIHHCFTHAWVPGESQKAYALKLGFDRDRIKTGYYSADTPYFSEVFKKIQPQKKENFPHKFIFAGRYIASKGIFTLWNTFTHALEQTRSDWELWCLGTGELYPQKREHPAIRHFGFVQPKEMEHYLAQTGVFILPSTFEPWGVVVHEMAAAGMPMICSDKVGAASIFLQPDNNGFLFKAGNEKALESLLIRVMQMSDDDLSRMGELSHELAGQITPKIWAGRAMAF